MVTMHRSSFFGNEETVALESTRNLLYRQEVFVIGVGQIFLEIDSTEVVLILKAHYNTYQNQRGIHMKKLLKAIVVLLTITLLCTSCNKPVPSEDGSSEGTTPSTLSVEVFSQNATSVQGLLLGSVNDFFVKKYPDVKLDIRVTEVGTDKELVTSFFQKIATEMMAGRGPDFIFYDSSIGTSIDIYKMFDSGLFEDMDKFIKNDKEFNLSDYNTTVIDALRYDDKQYAFPFTYQMPMFYTTKEIMDKAQINPDNFDNSDELMDEFSAYWDRNKDNKDATPIFSMPGYMGRLYYFTNLPVVNHLTRISNLDTPEVKRTVDFYKSILPYEPYTIGFDAAPHVMDETLEQCMFIFDDTSFSNHFKYIRALKTLGEPVYFPWRDFNGKINCEIGFAGLINASSTNKQNAWNFIKTFVSEEVQKNVCNIAVSRGMPINNEAMKIAFSYYEHDGSELFSEGDLLYKTAALDRTELDKFLKLQDDIGGAYIRYPADRGIFGQMLPYCEGEKPYEETLADAKEYIDIYLTE